MKNNKTLIMLPLLLLSILAILPAAFHPVRAATGNVCLQASGTVGCPGSPVLFASQGSQLMVAVNILGSDPLNGFDVSIRTDQTVLQGADAQLTGTVLGATPTVLLKCLDGVLVTGTVCASQDGPGVLHFSAVKTGPVVSGTGLLFTAVYNVVAKTGLISLNFAVDAADCASTSVAGGVCVSISNGTATLDPETVTGATFSNNTDYSISASPASFVLAPSISGISTITLTSTGGFSDIIDITVTPSAGLSASCADAFLGLPGDGTAMTTCTFSAAAAGSYTATVKGTGETSPFVTHSVSIAVMVTTPAFSIGASPTTLNIAPGDFGTSTISVASIAGFTGTVSLTAVVSPAGPTASLSPTSIVLGLSGTSTLTVTVPGGTAAGMYTVTVTGTGSASHSVDVHVNVGLPDFAITAVPAALSIPRVNPTHNGVSAIDLSSINNFAASLTLSVSVSGPVAQTPGEVPGGPAAASLTKSTIVLTPGGSDFANLLVVVTRATDGTGLDTVTITATGGGRTHTVQVLVYVVDYTLSIADPVVTIINDGSTLSHPAQTTVTIFAVGAPASVSNGFDIAEAVPALNAAYTYSPSSGRIIDPLPATDTTQRRCFMAVFDSVGNLITPILAGSHVASFAAPVVHINGDQDGDPPDFNGCRFDAGAGPNVFGSGPGPGNPVFPKATVEVLPGTPNGVYVAKVCWQSGSLINCVNLEIHLVSAPPFVPAFNQFNWKDHKISLGLDTIETFTAGVNNPAGNPTIYVQIIVVAQDSNGNTAIGTSGVVTAPPNSNTNNIGINMDVSGLSGVVTFVGSVQWGLTPSAGLLTENSVQHTGTASKNSGAFLVTA